MISLKWGVDTPLRTISVFQKYAMTSIHKKSLNLY